jgi:hypothetical protein
MNRRFRQNCYICAPNFSDRAPIFQKKICRTPIRRTPIFGYHTPIFGYQFGYQLDRQFDYQFDYLEANPWGKHGKTAVNAQYSPSLSPEGQAHLLLPKFCLKFLDALHDFTFCRQAGSIGMDR